MSLKRSRWGIWFFLFSIVLTSILFVVELRIAPNRDSFVYRQLIPALGIGFSILSLLSGHFSYPRVHNLKVYLIGYLVGVYGLFYFLVYDRPQPMTLAPLLSLIFLSHILVLILPSYVKYRTTKYLTLSITGAQAAILGLITRHLELVSWIPLDLRISSASGFPSWFSFVPVVLIIVFSVKRLRDEFYLGGLISGTALLYAFGWASPLIFFDYVPFERMIFAAVPIYMVAGIMIHWFSRMEHRVSYDPLLHIYNRAFCEKIIEEQSNINTGAPLGIAMVDIDHFKKVNDTHGHQAGDDVLFHVAQTISREVVPDGIVCRYGGEEIAVFFPRKKVEEVKKIMESVRSRIEQMSVHYGKKRLRVTISCGISMREDRSQNIEKVIERADKALYKAKQNGRNKVVSARGMNFLIRNK